MNGASGVQLPEGNERAEKIQQLTENYSLPFAVELIPAINYFIFVGLCFGFWYGVRMIFPHAFDNSYVIVIFGIPFF